MKSTIRVILTLVVVSTAVGFAQAESGWSWKSWMPFGSKSASPAVRKPVKKSEPSMWTKFNNSSKTFFAKSKAAVPSWFMPETQKRVRKSSDVAKQSSGRVKQEVRTAKRSFWDVWSTPEQPEERPTTVSDWISLPKPE